MIRRIGIFAVFVIIVLSCTEIPSADNGKYLAAVEVDCSSNALRASVEVAFKSSCHWSVSYWEKRLGPESAKTTSLMDSGCTSAVLLHLSPLTEYEYCVNIQEGGQSAVSSFVTTSFPEDFPVYPVIRTQLDVWRDGYVFQCEDEAPGYLTLCDFSAKVHWYDTYGDGVINFDYDAGSGLIALLLGSKNGDSSVDRYCRELRVVDMAGNVFLSYPASGILEGAHHWVSFTPDNHLAVVCGDGFKVLDLTGNELFCWNETMVTNPRVTSVGADSEGNYYVTEAGNTNVVKVDGKSGKVLYRFGEGGDVILTEDAPKGNMSVPYDTFFSSGAHSIIVYGSDSFSFYANGDKVKMIARGVFVTVDPVTKKARYDWVSEQPVPQYSPDLGSVMVVDEHTLLFCGTYPNPIPAFGMSRNLQFLSDKGAMVRNITRSGISARAQYVKDNEIVW